MCFPFFLSIMDISGKRKDSFNIIWPKEKNKIYYATISNTFELIWCRESILFHSQQN